MATFRFVGRDINIHWNGYDIKGPAGTVFSIPDQLYEEFESDIRGAEPSLEWIDTNEFQTLSSSVSAATLSAATPITIASTSTGRIISFSSGTALNGYLLSADGTGGAIWNPASTSGLTSVVGISPISTVISGGVVSVSIDQALLSVNDAATALTTRTYVKNSSGSTINKGQVVYITGADGTNALIGLASNTSDAASSKTLGIAANTMTNNAFGYVIENGQLSNIDTSGATAGSAVWLGSTPGSYQFTIPSEPNHFVYLGVVTKANVSTGEILVKVQNGYELNELHDVFTTGVSTSLPLVYNATSDGWIAQALSSVGIADNAIVASKIVAAAVGSAALADNSVVSSKIAASAVTSGHIAAGAVGTAALATGAVVSSKIAASAVTSGHIADGSITNLKYATGSIGSAAIGSGAVGSSELATNAVVTANINALAVTSAKLADNAVVTAKINALAVTVAKIGSGSSSSGQVLTADGSGGATFASITTGTKIYVTTLSGTGTWTVPTGVKEFELFVMSPGAGGGGGGLFRGTSIPSATNVGSSGGGGGGSGAFVYIPRYPVESGTTSYSYSLANPGTGGATISGSQGTGVSKTELISNGNIGGNASGATTFGPYITLSAAIGGSPGSADKVNVPNGGAGGTGSLLTLSNNLIFNDVVYSAQRGGATGGTSNQAGTNGSGQNAISTIASTVIGSFYGVHSLIANGYPIVAESYTAQGALIGTVSQSGNTNSVTSSIGTVNSASSQNMNGIPGGSASGGGANANTTAGRNGAQGINNSGSSGGGVAVTYSTGSQGTITIVGSSGANAKSVNSNIGTGGGGGGGGGTSITSSASTANQTATGYVITSGGGGDGARGLIFIRYIV